MQFQLDDGGRTLAGYKGHAGDCVARSIAIAAQKPYEEIYQHLASGTGAQRASRRNPKRSASARNGINVRRKWFKNYMTMLGFEWVPTMGIGTGCKVHLMEGELPAGRLVVALSKHYTAVIDGVIRDTFDPRSQEWMIPDGTNEDGSVRWRRQHRCVYGYWKLAL